MQSSGLISKKFTLTITGGVAATETIDIDNSSGFTAADLEVTVNAPSGTGSAESLDATLQGSQDDFAVASAISNIIDFDFAASATAQSQRATARAGFGAVPAMFGDKLRLYLSGDATGDRVITGQWYLTLWKD